jgi:hypothetical protein
LGRPWAAKTELDASLPLSVGYNNNEFCKRLLILILIQCEELETAQGKEKNPV